MILLSETVGGYVGATSAVGGVIVAREAYRCAKPDCDFDGDEGDVIGWSFTFGGWAHANCLLSEVDDHLNAGPPEWWGRSADG